MTTLLEYLDLMHKMLEKQSCCMEKQIGNIFKVSMVVSF